MSDKGMTSSDDLEEDALYKQTLETKKPNIRIDRRVQRQREIKIRHGSHK